MKFWTVLSRRDCRKTTTPNCHKYATFLGGFFNFLWATFFWNFYVNIFVSALKSCIIQNKEKYKKVYKKLIIIKKQATDLFWNKSVIHRGSDSMVSARVSGVRFFFQSNQKEIGVIEISTNSNPLPPVSLFPTAL